MVLHRPSEPAGLHRQLGFTLPDSRFFVHMIRRIGKHIRQLHDTRGDVGDASYDGRFGQAHGGREHVLVLTGRKVRLVLLATGMIANVEIYTFVIVGAEAGMLRMTRVPFPGWLTISTLPP
jgi:hypothetical protein